MDYWENILRFKIIGLWLSARYDGFEDKYYYGRRPRVTYDAKLQKCI